MAATTFCSLYQTAIFQSAVTPVTQTSSGFQTLPNHWSNMLRWLSDASITESAANSCLNK